MTLRGKSSIGRFDHRFTRQESALTWLRSGFMVWPLTATFGFLALWAWKRVPDKPEIENYMFAASACFFLFVSAIPVTAAIGTALVQSDGDSYPTPTSLRYKLPAGFSTIDGLITAGAGLILLINAYYLLLLPDSVTAIQFELAASLALKVALTLIACSISVSFLSKADQLRALERLERDIVLHDVDIPEIKRRLEEDYLGREFSSWLQEQVAEIETSSRALAELIDQTPKFFEDLNSLDKSLMHECAGRINEFQSKVQKLANVVRSSQEQLKKRLNKLLERAKNDEFVLKLINANLKQLDQITKETLGRADSLQRRLSQAKPADVT